MQLKLRWDFSVPINRVSVTPWDQSRDVWPRCVAPHLVKSKHSISASNTSWKLSSMVVEERWFGLILQQWDLAPCSDWVHHQLLCMPKYSRVKHPTGFNACTNNSLCINYAAPVSIFIWKMITLENVFCILLNQIPNNLFSRGTYSIIHLTHHSAVLKPRGLMLCLPEGFKVYSEHWTINYSCPNNYLCVWLPQWCKQKLTGWCWQLFDDGCKAAVHISSAIGTGSTCTLCWYTEFIGRKKKKKVKPGQRVVMIARRAGRSLYARAHHCWYFDS